MSSHPTGCRGERAQAEAGEASGLEWSAASGSPGSRRTQDGRARNSSGGAGRLEKSHPKFCTRGATAFMGTVPASEGAGGLFPPLLPPLTSQQ